MYCLNSPSLGPTPSWVILDELPINRLCCLMYIFGLECYIAYCIFSKNIIIIIDWFIFPLQKQTGTSGSRITSIVFLTPEERVMKVDEAQIRGYGVANTPTRLVVRSPHNAPEMYTQDVSSSSSILTDHAKILKLV